MSMCPVGTQGQKEALLLSVKLKCFAHLKAGVVLWLPSMHKMLSSFLVSAKLLWTERTFSKERHDTLSEIEEDE